MSPRDFVLAVVRALVDRELVEEAVADERRGEGCVVGTFRNGLRFAAWHSPGHSSWVVHEFVGPTPAMVHSRIAEPADVANAIEAWAQRLEVAR